MTTCSLKNTSASNCPHSQPSPLHRPPSAIHHLLSIFFLAVAIASFPALCADEEGADTAPPKPKPSGFVKGPKGTFVYDAEDKEKPETIPLKSIDYENVRKICQPMLSEKGTLSYLSDRNAVLVFDKVKVIKKIRETIEAIDREPVNIRILVEYEGAVNESKQGIAFDWKPDNDMHQVDDPRLKITKAERGKVKIVGPDGLSLGAENRKTRQSSNNSMFISTMSGHPASIWAEKNIVDPVWLDNYFRQPGVVLIQNGSPYLIAESTPPLIMRNVGSSLMALPRLLDSGLINVELYPEVSYLDGNGRRRSIKVESLTTTVTVANGARVQVGGFGEGKSDAARSIFGPELFRTSSRDKTGYLGIYLTATADVKPSPSSSDSKPTDPAKKDTPRPLRPETPWQMR